MRPTATLRTTTAITAFGDDVGPGVGRHMVSVPGREGSGLGTRQLRHDLRRAVLSGASTIVVNLDGEPALTRAAVAALLRVNRFCSLRGGQMVVRASRRTDLGLLPPRAWGTWSRSSPFGE